MWKCQRLIANYRMKKGLEDSNGTGRTATSPKILVIEDDQALSRMIQTNLRRLGFHTEGVSDGAEAIDWIVKNAITLALLDYRLPDMSGEQVIKALAKRQRTVPFIVITGHGDEKVAVEMMKLGARDYLVKDTAFLDRLSRAVERTVEQLAIEDKLAEAERALRESEGKYRTLLETSAAPVYWVEVPGGKITFVNKKAENLFGSKRKDLLGHKLFEFVPEDEVALHREKMKEAARDMKIEQQPIPQVIVRPGGELRYTEVYPTMFKSEGKIVAQVVCPDITERKRAEETLQTSEERYRLVVDTANEAIVVAQDGMLKLVNPKAAEITGYSQSELKAMPFVELIHPDDRELVVERHQRRLGGGDLPNVYGFKIVCRDGQVRWVEIRAVYITWDARPATLNLLSDVTERKLVEEALRLSEVRFREMADLLPEVVYEVNEYGCITYANQTAFATFGYTQKDIESGVTILDLIVPEEHSRLIANLKRWLYGEEAGSVEYTARSRSGGTFPMLVHASAIRDTEGKVVGARGVAVNITKRKRAEEEIKRHIKRVEVLHAVAQAVSQTLDLNDMLSNAMDMVTGVMEVAVANVYIFDEETGELNLRAHKGVSNEFLASMSSLKLEREEIERLRQWKGPTIALERALNQPNLATIMRAIQEEGLQSSVVVPFRLKGVVSGAMALACRHPRQYSAEDIDLLQAIGNEIAVGIENALLLIRTRELSVTDELTGLYNRRYFYQALEAEIDRAQRYGHSFCLAILDLNSFKEYNDRFGHLNGDAVLRSLARTLKSALRKSDMAFRYGGDELTIILPVTEAYRARKIVDRIRSKWLETPKSDNLILEAPLDFSAGIAQFPQDAGTADGLVFLADTALFHSKRQGGYKSSLVSDLGTVTLGVLDSAMLDHVYALAATVDARDPYTYGHSERVAHISETIGRAIGLSMDELVNLHAAALLHDIGKVGVPDSILTKPGRLNEDEWRVMERHPVEGARIVGHVTELAALVPMIRHHHEWYNGTGYPDRFKGEDIPLGARIISIADAYDTMTTQRPYRDTVSEEEALEELRRCCGTQFDLRLVEAFCGIVEEHKKRIRVGG